jgi:2-keto-3-deoxy-L-rhamnonate aldolase RhmA
MLAKLRSGGLARVCGLGHFLPFYIRYASLYKYDGIWLDLEHRAMGSREVQALLALCQKNDIDCMVRPPTYERTRLYRYLEEGASGFMMPFTSSGDIARHIVECVKFPPLGNRGIDGAGMDGDYLLDAWRPGSTYTADANRETFVVGQIETPEAVTNIDEIAGVDGIDVLFVGPADLGLRLAAGTAGRNLSVAEAIERVADAARRHGKAWGTTVGSTEEMARLRKMGAQILPWGGDFDLRTVLKTRSEEIDATIHE